MMRPLPEQELSRASFPRKNVTPADSKPGRNPASEDSVPLDSRRGNDEESELYLAAGTSRAVLGELKWTKSTWEAVEITECFCNF